MRHFLEHRANVSINQHYLQTIIMTESQDNQPLELRELEASLDQLVAQYAAVKNENQSLKVRQDELLSERAKLLEKTNLARTRINDMIERLRAMEQGS